MTVPADDRSGSSPGSISATQTHVEAFERLPPGTLLSERYRVLKTAGVGGMGVVYLARDEKLGIDVAVKVLRADLAADPGVLERFRGELLSAREVTHKHVVRTHDIGEHGGLRFLTMTYVPGRSLREILEQDGPLPLPRALTVARQVAQALAAAHEKGIVHRDLKPGNVLVDPQGNAYVTDFGIARSLGREGLTRAGAIVGTPDYLAPEQISGDPIDARTDLYAFGILLYEMVSGELPFRGESQAETLAQRLAGRPRDLKETGARAPAWVRGVIRRCLERSPARRYPDAHALLEDLEQSRETRATRSSLWLAAAALLVAAIAVAILLARRPHSPAAVPAPPSAAAAHRAVAVLPLADQTADPSLAWTSTGIAEMLSANLSESPNLRVLDSLRVLSGIQDLRVDPARLDDLTARQLRELWSVDTLVTGAVRRAGSRMHVDLTVISSDAAGVRASRRLSAETPGPEGLFRLVENLGAELRQALGLTMTRAMPPSGAQTSSLQAARSFEEGSRSLALGEDATAASVFERAVAADPRFAAALERLAQTYQSLGYHEKARAAAEKALAAAGDAPTLTAYRARARLALVSGNPAEAEKVFRQILERYPNATEIRVDLANAQSAQGHNAEAVTTLKKLVEADPNNPRAWFLLGRNAVLMGDSARAVGDYLVRALALQNQLKSEKGKAEVVNAMGVAYEKIGDSQKALENYTAAIALRRRIGDERGLATTLRNRAVISVALGRSAKAEEDLREARQIYERIGDRQGLADVFNDFGVLREGRGAYAAALESYQASLRIRHDLGDERLLAQSYDNVGYIYYLQGEYDHALVYWQQALDLRRKIGEKTGVILSEQNLGFLQLAQGKWDEATQSFLEALQRSREIDYKPAATISLGNLAMLQHHQGRYAAALDSFREALQIARELDLKPALTEFTIREAEALLDLGLLDAVRERLDRAEAWVRETGNREQAADREVVRGDWLLRTGDPQAARTAFGRAEALARESGSKVSILHAQISSAMAASAGKGSSAVALSIALREAESLGHALLTLEASEALAKAQLSSGRAREAKMRLERAIDLAQRIGWGEGLYRLYDLEGRALEAAGDRAAASEAFARAKGEIAKLRENVPPEMRASFEALPQVQEIVRRKGKT